jgi:hypothetical protein
MWIDSMHVKEHNITYLAEDDIHRKKTHISKRASPNNEPH